MCYFLNYFIYDEVKLIADITGVSKQNLEEIQKILKAYASAYAFFLYYNIGFA